MSKNNENKLVTKLRFPEFINEKWEKKTIDETCEVLNNLRKPLTSNLREKGEFPYYGASGIIDYVKDFIFNERLLLIGEDGAKWGAYEKTAFIAEGKYWVNNHAHVLKPTGVVDTLLEKYLVKLDISPFITGAAPPKLTLGKLKSIPVPIPNSKKEQQKIATCLSSLDEVITAESQKLEVLKDHKKGLLQKLLPQAGETVPKFRFKEFEDSGEWKETTLTQVADYENGKAHEQDIADDGEFIVVNSKFISQDGEVKKFTNTAFCPATKGDILMVLSDIPNGKAIAKCFLVEEDNRYTVNQRICRITPRNVNSKILYYLLNRNPYFLAFDDGVKQTNLRKEDVLNCPLMIPENPKEQETIADTLSSIDDLIIAQNQKLEALQLHKKGLLQGLFPSINNEE
ncbi:MAG: restriction endonuclease subunit S [Bacteroidia bacterium]|nr:restriction endonuclease subunit S [Bacteroidia bacterium]